MSLHAAGDPAVRLALRVADQPRTQEHPEQEDEDGDHDRRTDRLGGHELPPQQHDHDDAEFEHQIGGSHFERHRRGKIGALAEHRPGERDGRIGTRGGCRSKRERGRNRPRPVVRQEPAHLAMRDNGLHHSREREPEDQRPQDLPPHGEGHLQRVQNRVHHDPCKRAFSAKALPR